MTEQDELRALWQSQAPDKKYERAEIMNMIQTRAQRFDRRVRNRNLRECIASGVVAPVFFWFAWHAANRTEAAGELLVAASSLWVIFYLLRYGRSQRGPDASQNLTTYGRALVERFDQQIRLLSSVKYWYLLPFYVGLMVMSAGGRHLNARIVLLYTAVFLVLWYLNEVVSVRKLRQCRARTVAQLAQDGNAGGAQ